jgi:hypothetical protein
MVDFHGFIKRGEYFIFLKNQSRLLEIPPSRSQIPSNPPMNWGEPLKKREARRINF